MAKSSSLLDLTLPSLQSRVKLFGVLSELRKCGGKTMLSQILDIVQGNCIVHAVGGGVVWTIREAKMLFRNVMLSSCIVRQHAFEYALCDCRSISDASMCCMLYFEFSKLHFALLC